MPIRGWRIPSKKLRPTPGLQRAAQVRLLSKNGLAGANYACKYRLTIDYSPYFIPKILITIFEVYLSYPENKRYWYASCNANFDPRYGRAYALVFEEVWVPIISCEAGLALLLLSGQEEGPLLGGFIVFGGTPLGLCCVRVDYSGGTPLSRAGFASPRFGCGLIFC